jgi:hypothetical protein
VKAGLKKGDFMDNSIISMKFIPINKREEIKSRIDLTPIIINRCKISATSKGRCEDPSPLTLGDLCVR